MRGARVRLAAGDVTGMLYGAKGRLGARGPRVALAGAVLAVLGGASGASGAINLFVNGSGTGVWEDGNNWSAGSAPVAGDSAFIDSGFAVTSSAATNVCNELQVGVGANSYGSNGNPGGTGMLSILTGSTITTGGNLVVGQDQTSDDSSGTVNIAAGGTLSIGGGNSFLGFFGQSLSDPTVGTMNVNGGTFNFNAGNNNGTLWVGGDSITNHVARGVLNVNAGTATGAAVRVGDFGAGTLNMAGGSLTSNFYMSVGLGNNPNAGSGTVNVTGGIMNLAQLTVNESKVADCVVNQSAGTVNIGNVTGIDGYNARIGLSAAGRGFYYMTGGTLNVAGNDLAVGPGLYGQMNVGGGSAVNVNYMAVSGKASDYGLSLGGSNNGTAIVNQTGGTVTIFPTSLLGVFYQGTNGGTSTYNLAGGTLTTDGISVDPGSTAKTFNFDGGTLVANAPMTVPNPARNTNVTNFATTLSAGGGTINTASFAVTWANPLTGPGGLTKTGAGTLALTQPSTYGGGTTVSAGTLSVTNTTGSGTGTGAVTVAPAGTLAGTGTVGGATTVNGTLSPGGTGAAGTISLASSLALTGSADTLVELGSATSFDHANVGTSLTYGGTLEVAFLAGYTPAQGATFDLFDFASESGTFANVVFDAGATPYTFNPSTGVLTFTASAVPEPASVAVAVTAAALGLSSRRRRTRRTRRAAAAV